MDQVDDMQGEWQMPFYHSHLPQKRQRLDNSIVVNMNYQWSQDPLSLRTQPDSPSTLRLDTLPTEVVLMILEHSLEASLIHTCRRFMQIFPAYVPYTKALALKALSTPPTYNPFDFPSKASKLSRNSTQTSRPRFRGTLDQACLRDIVFSSFWFGEPQLCQTWRELFKCAVLRASALVSSEVSGAAVSSWQLCKLNRFVRTLDFPHRTDELTLRLTADSGQKIYLRAAPDLITITRPFPATDSVIQVVEFGTWIPSGLFCQPVNKFKLTMLDQFCRHKCLGKNMPLECDHAVLSQALFDSIAVDKLRTLNTLLKIDSRINLPELLTLVGIEHIRKAMKSGNPMKLTALLDHSWEYSKGTNITEIELQAAIDEARNLQYPNWIRTTKAVAMEIATRWKIAEVENAGGTATRHMGKWPPVVTITEPGCIFPQTWYIPVEGNDDLLMSC